MVYSTPHYHHHHELLDSAVPLLSNNQKDEKKNDLKVFSCYREHVLKLHRVSESLERLVKAQIAGLHSQSFRFSKLVGGAKNLHLLQVSK